MILSLSVGIYVSTCSRSDRKAMFFTVLILLAVTFVPALLTAIFEINGQSIPENELWKTLVISPGYGIMQTMYSASAGGSILPEFSYWLSILWQWLLAAALIAAASSRVPHSWEESGAKKPRLARLKLGFRVKARSPKGRVWLDRNPFLWLALQDEESSPRNVWLYVLSIFAIWMIGALKFGIYSMAGQPIATMTIAVLVLPLEIWIAAQATRRFSEDRSNNTFELLLSTPLSARQIIQGQWLALIKQFAGPMVFVLVWELLMEISAHSLPDYYVGPPFWVQIAEFVTGTVALAWAGMWLGLRCKSRIRAILGSLILVLFVPSLLTTMITGVIETLVFQPGNMAIAYPQNAYPQSQLDFQKWLLLIVTSGIPLLIYFLIAAWAIWRLPRNFRQLAVRR